jgi:hypothetical protein
MQISFLIYFQTQYNICRYQVLFNLRREGVKKMNSLNQLAKTLDQYYAKLPALPKGGKDFIVSIASWLALIFGLLAILSAVSAFGIFSFMSPFAVVAGIGRYAFAGILSTIILLVQGIIELMAFSPLKTNQVKGWNLMYYSLILSVISSITYLSVSSVISALIGALIGYYFLYQVKSYYK